MKESEYLAAVAVPVRGEPNNIEIFWVRRAPGLPFLGGFWALPGGRVDPADWGHKGPDETCATRRSAALLRCVSRELREETGLALTADPESFEFLGETCTPSMFSIRYRAAYYLARVPRGSELNVSFSDGELVEGEWIRPLEAIARWLSGSIVLTSVLRNVLLNLASGTEGLAERLGPLLAAEETKRIWDLYPGLTICPLRTPTLPPATHTNCYIVGGRELIVIDPASPYADEQAVLDREIDLLAEKGRRVREIWLTHHHRDHVSGARHLAQRLGVPIAAHEKTAELVADEMEVDRFLLDDQVEVLPPHGDIPERRLRAIFTPGHAPGHHCFLEESLGTLITGDMVAGTGTILIDPDEGDMIQYLDSLERMKTLGANLLAPAHGNVIVDVQRKLDLYVTHRRWREKQVANALQKLGGTASTMDLVPVVYSDVPSKLHQLAARSLLAHLIKMVKEGNARKRGTDTFELIA